MSPTLYKRDGSPVSGSVLMLVELLKLSDIAIHEVALFGGGQLKEDLTKVNPQVTVPTFVDGDFVICDSHAILAYLVGAYAADDTLYPKDLKKRALVDQRLYFESGILFPAFITIIKKLIHNEATSVLPEDLQAVHKAYGFLETFLSGQTWLVGDKMTIADISCVATVTTHNEYAPIDAEKYPNITRWLNQFSKLDFYNKANKPGLTAIGQFIRSKIA